VEGHAEAGGLDEIEECQWNFFLPGLFATVLQQCIFV